MSNNSNPAPIAHSVVAVTNAGIDIYDLYDRTPQVGACPGLTERMPNSSNRHGSHSPSLSMFRLRRAEISTVLEGLDAIDYAAADGLSLSCSAQRSEEHTSELQSRENLVCRLLLRKK